MVIFFSCLFVVLCAYLCKCIFPWFGELFFNDPVEDLVYTIGSGFFSIYVYNLKICLHRVTHFLYVPFL